MLRQIRIGHGKLEQYQISRPGARLNPTGFFQRKSSLQY
jgi:hypothetical protein